MRERSFSCEVVFLILLGLFFPSLGQTEELSSEPLSITHSVQSYVQKNSTMTVSLNLEIQNNGTTNLNNVSITLASLFTSSLSLVGEPEKISMGNLAAGQTTSTTYILKTYILHPSEQIETRPISWEINYQDEANQALTAVLDSRYTIGGGM